jgi:hypothetical protein
MDIGQAKRIGEAGSTLIEFVVVATMLFVMLIGICAGGNLYFTHNAMVESTRRGARFAATQAANTPVGSPRTTAANVCDATGPALTDIQNYTVYGNTAGTGPKLVNGIDRANVCVEYSNFGVGQGSVSVSIINYDFHFVVPLISRTITMPAYRTTVAGESAGVIP